MSKYKVSVALLLCLTAFTYSQNIVINEIMSDNGSTIYDEEGDTPDWIELYNPGEDEVWLTGFGLSDNPDELFRWTFPQVSIQPDEHIVVFTSNKNRKTGYWKTVIDEGDEWKYFVGDSQPPADWKDMSFDDSSWQTGISGFGFGDEDDNTVIPETGSLYLRKIFSPSVDDQDIESYIFHADYDDGFVAYLNGTEIARANLGQPGIEPAFDEFADNITDAVMSQGGAPQFFFAAGTDASLYDRMNVLCIQVHNCDASSNDMTMIPFFTVGFDGETDDSPGEVNPILAESIPKMHSNFRLTENDSELILTNPAAEIHNQITFGNIDVDTSFGRNLNLPDQWLFFAEPTPSEPNYSEGYYGYCAEPEFSIKGGFYQNSVFVELTAVNPDEIVRYTLDGSFPHENSQEYNSVINISETKVLRAACFAVGKIPSKTVTNTYFIDEDIELPIVSISANPEDFFDDEIGIYALGDSAESIFPYFGANFWKDWEKPINIELFETDKEQVINMPAGVKIFGNWTRGHPQKSLAVYARDMYGPDSFDHQIFPEKAIDNFGSLILRNSGNDWESTMFRDGLIGNITNEYGMVTQAFQQAVVFINGEYWGIHNIREKINEQFMDDNFGVNENDLELLEGNAEVIFGSGADYHELITFVQNNDLSFGGNYNFVIEKMNIENYIDYICTQLFFINTDWPSRNIRFWREVDESKWQWLLFDTDFGFGFAHGADFEMLDFALEENGPSYPNPPWATLLFRKLIENEYFKSDFINRFADLMNTSLRANNLSEHISQKENMILSEIQRHQERWDRTFEFWENEVLLLRYFAGDRQDYVQEEIMQKFSISGVNDIYLDIYPPNTGRIDISTLNIGDFPWTGEYFSDAQLILSAVDVPGYRFAGWSGDITSDSRAIPVTPDDTVSLIAWFEEDVSTQNTLVINEINYNSSNAADSEDWVEIYNNSSEHYNLQGWEIRDSEEQNSYIITELINLPPNTYHVFCRDIEAFSSIYPEVENVTGTFNFGFSGSGEQVKLLNAIDELIDIVEYDDTAPWPIAADGGGKTLSLINPEYDNALAQNWLASVGNGTPGSQNDVYNIEPEQEFSDIAMLPAYPNPFYKSSLRSSDVVINFYIPNEAKVEIEIFNIKGQKVKTLLNETKEAGADIVLWNGTDSNNKNVSTGVYFYKMKSGEFEKVRKMILIK
jgi:hypothetical protein